MAHFAILNTENIVIDIVVLNDEDVLDENGFISEEKGIIFLKNFYANQNLNIKRTCYNTRGGIHYQSNSNIPSEDQSKAFRKTHAGLGYKYDNDRDAFISPKPFNSWILNETTCLWEPPLPYPIDRSLPITNSTPVYIWDEENIKWVIYE